MNVPGVLVGSEGRAVRRLIERIIVEVPADLRQVSLFGSRARGQARPDSDIDILLIFHALSEDREPHAGHAEWIARSIAEQTLQPLTVWSVSLADFLLGNRTPMLVDALVDSVTLWTRGGYPLKPVAFTPLDAVRCTRSLLQRVSEGSDEFAGLARAGEFDAAARRVRDDLIRLCTAHLLLRGWTRPRRAEVIDAFVSTAFDREPPPTELRMVLTWVRGSYGEDGHDELARVKPPRIGLGAAARAVESIRHSVIESLVLVERALPL